MESKFYRTIKSGLLKHMTPQIRCLVYCSAKSDIQVKCVSYLVFKHLIMTIFALHLYLIPLVMQYAFDKCFDTEGRYKRGNMYR